MPEDVHSYLMYHNVSRCCLVPLGLLSFYLISIWDVEAQVGVSSKVESFYSLVQAVEAIVYLACYFMKLECKLCYL